MPEPEEEITVPDGLAIVERWIEGLYGSVTGESLWALLDEQVRIANTQVWILNTFGRPDDELRRQLSGEVSVHPYHAQMLEEFVQQWRSVYSAVSAGFGVLAHTELVGPDMELVVITAPEHIGRIEAGVGIPGHSFVVRLAPQGWVIAALARRLPVPGWPPTEQHIEGLSIDG